MEPSPSPQWLYVTRRSSSKRVAVRVDRLEQVDELDDTGCRLMMRRPAGMGLEVVDVAHPFNDILELLTEFNGQSDG